MKKECLLKNEDGSVLVIALIMLVLLTLLGISATTNTEIEVQIAGNDALYRQNRSMAEAGAMEAAQIMEGTPLANDPPTNPTWLKPIGTVSEATNIPDPGYWTANGQPSGSGASLPNTRYLAVFRRIVGSADMTKTSVYDYAIYSRSNSGPRDPEF
jgi:hypothetical protein